MELAFVRSKKLGLAQDDNLAGKIPSLFKLTDIVKKLTVITRELADGCPWNYHVWQELKKVGLPTGIITIGYMKYHGDYEFFHTEEDLMAELKEPGKNEIKIHVWLSFDNGFIFDPTFPAISGNGKDLAPYRYEQLMIHGAVKTLYDQQPGDPEYFPVICGGDFLIKTGVIKPY